MSGKQEKVTKDLWLSGHFDTEEKVPTEYLRNTLTLIYLGSYIQGIELILRAESEWSWGINIDEVIRIWQGGCIIRSKMLEVLPDFYRENQTEACNDFMDQIPPMRIHMDELLGQIYTPTPVASSVAQYFRALSEDNLPTNLIQAMRDSF